MQSTICDAWLRLVNYNDNFSQSKFAWFNQQHKLILATNSQALKRMKTSAEKSASWAEGKALKIPLIIWCYCVIIQKVKIRSQIITKVNCLSWNQSSRTQMFISSNHLMVRVPCVWLTSGSYLTFISHRRITCHLVKPLIQSRPSRVSSTTVKSYIDIYGEGNGEVLLRASCIALVR